jgi:hypothetical protein
MVNELFIRSPPSTEQPGRKTVPFQTFRPRPSFSKKETVPKFSTGMNSELSVVELARIKINFKNQTPVSNSNRL